jgi:hypothetical protein
MLRPYPDLKVNFARPGSLNPLSEKKYLIIADSLLVIRHPKAQTLNKKI